MPERNWQPDILGRQEAYYRGFIDGYNCAFERLKTLMYLAECQIPQVIYMIGPRKAWAYLEGGNDSA
ncbi:MAG: hypothetical protein ACPLTR_09610 [Thermacetogeniaceae bacterium]